MVIVTVAARVSGRHTHNDTTNYTARKPEVTMRTLIVHNTSSGFGSDAIFEFERALIRKGDECVLRALADEANDAEALEDAEAFDVVVVSGGDGTVANALYALRGRGVPTCVFPSGTANLIAANIGNATEPAALARACRNGTCATCDLGEISWHDPQGVRHVQGFGLMAGTGFDAQLMAAAASNKRTQGEAAYFTAVLSNLKPNVRHFSITVDGITHECDGIACLVANNATMQGDIEVAPGCVMDDGLLDVIMLEVDAVTQLVRPIVSRLIHRDDEGRPRIRTFRGASIRVESNAPVPMEVDGDVTDGPVDSYEAVALPGCIRLVVDELSHYGHEKASPSGRPVMR